MIRGKILSTCGRLAFRAVISAGVVEQTLPLPSECRPSVSSCQQQPNRTITTNPKTDSSGNFKVHASCCGFPKDLLMGPSFVRERGVFGDDACFVAKYKSTHIVGVADGVGGWRKYGIDPSEFSSRLMRICSELVALGEFEPRRPDKLLAKAFEMLATPPRPIGSSTACVLIVHQDTLYSANLGDSGYLVLRKGHIIFRSREQTHYFNAPFQLSLPPENAKYSGFIGDSPENADLNSIILQSGDIVVLATDGLWDNVSEHLIVKHLSDIQPGDAQEACNGLALIARQLAFDTRHLSPFAVKASQHGIDAPGGKPDDITLVLLIIV